jgi:long-chain acyl-CoA synthetase
MQMSTHSDNPQNPKQKLAPDVDSAHASANNAPRALSPRERHLPDQNMTAITVAPNDLPLACLYRWERERANHVYLSQPMGDGVVQDITWVQAADQVRRIAAWLLAQGWPGGSRVAIVGKNSAHWLLADLAISMAGHVSVPIYPTFNAEALDYILQHSAARAAFIGKMDDTSGLQGCMASNLPLVALPLAPLLQVLQWNDLLAANAALQGYPCPPAEALATIMYTSGTTGRPKGVMHSFGALAWSVSSATRRVQMHGSDRLISYLPLAHVAERILIEQAGLRYGLRVFFAESLDTFIADIQRARPTVFFSVPRLWVKFQQGVHTKLPERKLQTLLRIPLLGSLLRRKILRGLGLDQCRLAAGGAAPMPAEVLRWYRNLGLDLIEVYGMTEMCGASHSTLPGGQETGTVGLPFDGFECRIDPINGEIQVRSECLTLGYYLQPELTAELKTADGWMRTGDKGEINASSSLHITGRVKDNFKTSKGKYVAPAPVEDLLGRHPDIEACCVSGANFAQPFALLLLSAEALARGATEWQDLHHSLQAHLQSVNAMLDAHEKLDFVAIVAGPWTPENGLVTPTLKVKRPEIEETYGQHYISWHAKHQPVVWADAV